MLLVHFVARRVFGVLLDELLSVVVEEKVPEKKRKNRAKQPTKGAYPRSRVMGVWPLARRSETERFSLVAGEIVAAKNAKTESNSPGGWFTRFCFPAAATFCRGPPSI